MGFHHREICLTKIGLEQMRCSHENKIFFQKIYCDTNV
jgi:hypothetical protein